MTRWSQTEATTELDEAIQRFLDAASGTELEPGTRYDSPAGRDFIQRRRTRVRPSRAVEVVGHVEDLRTDSGVPVRVYLPPQRQGVTPVVVYFHGGGWVMGDLELHDATCREIAARSSAVVVNVDYRLAPEHPFPAPLNDCHEAVGWAVSRAAEWGADSRHVVLVGSSAGANLAAATAVRWHEDDRAPLAGMVLIYPVLDARLETESYRSKADGYFLTAEQMAFFWDAYVQDGQDRTVGQLSPGLVEDVTIFPPTIVVTAEHDPLRDEGVAFAERLDEAGRLVHAIEARGQIHGFLTAFPDGAPAVRAMQVVVDGVRGFAGALD